MGDRHKLLEEITRSLKGYKIAVFTSFNFEVEFFERAILSRLMEGGVRKISLFVDRGEFEKALDCMSGKMPNLGLGSKYVVSPVDINGAFHPKMVLLLGEKKARLIVASANIKTTGYKRNHEVFNVIEYSENDTTYQDVIVGAISYLLQIDKVSYRLDSQIIKELTSFPYYSKTTPNGERYFLGNSEAPMIEQIIRLLPTSVDEIRIAVPYYDENLDALNRLSSFFPSAKVVLFIQQGKSTFPQDKESPYSIRIFDQFNDISLDYSSNFYHGKVFLFKTAEKDYIAYGSANCTGSALLRTFREGGNIECDFMDEGECGEFDAFFEQLHIVEGETLISHPSEPSVGTSKPLRFISAMMHREYVECRLREIRSVQQIEFSYEGEELEYEKRNSEYIVRVDLTGDTRVSQIFDLGITCDGESDQVRCWVIDQVSLSNNRREVGGKDDLDDFEEYSDGTKYQEDRYKLLKADLMCTPELMEYHKVMALAEQQKVLNEETQDDENDDFMVYTEMSYEYREMYRRYKAVSRIRKSFLNRFLYPDRYFKEAGEDSHPLLGSTEEPESEGEVRIHIRKATPDDKLFERFVKNRVKGFLDERFIEAVSFDHYMGVVQVVIEIFKKYNLHEIPWIERKDDERVEGIFGDEYVIRTKTAMITALTTKDLSAVDDAELYSKRIVPFTIGILLENHKMIREIDDHELAYELKKDNRKVLLILESKYGVRSQLSFYVRIAGSSDHNVSYRIIDQYGVKTSVDRLDDMYGYKEIGTILSEIKKRYGESTTAQMTDEVFCITTKTEEISSFFRLDVSMVNAIVAYFRNTGTTLKRIEIIVENISPKGKNPVISLKSIVSPQYSKWSQEKVYADGTKDRSPSRNYGLY